MPYYFFQEDYDRLVAQVADLRGKIGEAFRDAADSADQSSETWHDNFGFEDGQRQIMMHGRQLEKLVEVMSRAEILPRPESVSEEVSIGSAVRVEAEDSGETLLYRIGSYAVALNDVGVISYDSPIARLLLGARVGEVRAGLVGSGMRSFRVLGLE